MSESQHRNKKRKSAAGESISVVVDEPSSTTGPIFVNFPSVRPSKATPFTVYSREVPSSSDLTKQRTVAAGETEDVEYFSSNRDHLKGGEGSDCHYLPAVYDPSTGTVTVHPSAPLYLMAHRVKRLHAADQARAQAYQDTSAWRAKRNDLGETFGTRKAKSQIKAEERNRVDVGAMQGVKGHLMSTIVEKAVVAEDIPAPEAIPAPNLITTDPHEVYSRESLIPDDEWSAMSVEEIALARDDRSRLQLLPWSRGRYLEAKLRTIIAGPKEGLRKNLKYLYYLSCLHHFLSLASFISKSSVSEIQTKCPGMPIQVLNGLLSRFAERGSGKKYAITEKSKTKILAWICCLCLVLDGCVVEVGKVAKDLSMTDAKVQVIFKSLGCAVDVVSPTEREQLGITLQQAQANKRAVLKAPVKFPRIARRGPVKR